MTRPGEGHDLVRQRESRAQLLERLEALFDGTGLRDDGDQRAFSVGCAGVDQQALVEDGEADDEDVRAFDYARDFVHIKAVIVHMRIV